jgi:hypothetical protein
LIAFAGLIALAGSAAPATDYEITASGPLASILNDTSTSDGTTRGTLPPMLDLNRLDGGSFRATFRFTPVAPVAGPTASYALSATSGMTRYELLDPSGQVVHRGSNPSEPMALVSNNNGAAPFTADQVLLSSSVESITGLHRPAPRYGATPDFLSLADFNVGGYVGNGVDYLTSLAIPTDPAPYLAPPLQNRMFDVLLEFGDGDYGDRVGPYQYAGTQLTYNITAVTVTPVPEPTAAALALSAAGVLTACARRRRRG